MDDNASAEIVVAFPDQSESFVLGFEAGMIWQEMDGEGRPIIDRGYDEGFPIHAENVEVIRRMCGARNYRLEVQEEVDGWVPARMTWAGSSKPKLRIVP